MDAEKQDKDKIDWRDWTVEAFEEARKANKLVLLDLSASWCHWCHVMDDTTYSDKEIIRTINQNFVSVRVDIDKRPDISERYNKGGFPTTAFLSDRGESVWGGTYVPPESMKQVMKAIAESKSSGEIDSTLERERQPFLDLSKSLEKDERTDLKFVDSVFEDIFSTYDIQSGGFGTEPKFPHPDVVDLLLAKFRENGDRTLAGAVSSTLDHMTEGLYDRPEGGIFRYSMSKDWKQPHYEKMLDTNLGFLRNLSRARVILNDEKYAETAKGVAEYLLGTLMDSQGGGFYSSQDADEEYYGLTGPERKGRQVPKVIEEKFAGWNCDAVTTLIESGVLLDDKRLIDAGRSAWTFVSEYLWNPELKLVRHAYGEDTYLFDDQVSCLEALLSLTEIASKDTVAEMLDLMETLVGGVEKAFRHYDGGFGDIIPSSGAIGELAEPRRSLQANSRWARAYALLGATAFRSEKTDAARKILDSFSPKTINSNGLFAADYVLARWTVAKGPRVVEIHGADAEDITAEPLWLEAKKTLDYAAVIMTARKPPIDIGTDSDRPFAVICTSAGCSRSITDPVELSKELAGMTK